MELVSVEEAKGHLYIDGDAHDQWLALMIEAVSDAVALWVKDTDRLFIPEPDSNGDLVPSANVRPAVKAAVLVELASKFRYREGEGEASVESHEGHGYVLSRVATAYLVPLRKSTVT
jgi:hypothetical protein